MSRFRLSVSLCAMVVLAAVELPAGASGDNGHAPTVPAPGSRASASRGADQAAAVSVEAALGRLRSSPNTELHDYRARRYLHAVNRRFKAEAWMEVVTELTPLGAFRYEIVSERGSGYVRSKVLRTMLEREQSMWREGEVARGALTDENYTFAPLGWSAPNERDAAAAAEWFVAMTPKRRDTLLVVGRLVLDAATGELQRIEGRVAKSPSFWTNRVEIVRRYGRVNGVRVPLSTESVAHLKVAGRSEFDMTYEYERINGEAVAALPLSVSP